MRKNLPLFTLPAILLVFVVFHSTALGQFEMFSAMSAGAGINASGQAELEKQPTMLRLHIDIRAKGKDLEKALKNLDKQAAKAKKGIARLKPIKDSIKVGVPKISKANTQQQKQMEMMIRSGMSNSGRKPPKGLTMVKMVTLTASFKADWALDAETPSEQLLLVDELKTAIEKADISGQKDKDKLSPEEEELMEEAQSMHSFSSNEKIEPGTPVFVFIAKISDEESKKLMLEAFNKASKQAKDLTDAVHVPLGKLISVSGRVQNDMQEYGGGYHFGGHGYGMQQYMQELGVGSSLEKGEAISQECGPIKFEAHVTTVFKME